MSRPPPPPPPPQPAPLRGAASTSHLEHGTKHALRGADQIQRSSLRTVVDETSGVPVTQKLAEILMQGAVRVINVFREWDEDGDGMVSRKEFRKAMPLLGLQVPRPEVDALFDSWDPDGSGELSLRELSQRLKRPVEVPRKPKRKPSRKNEYGMSSIGHQPLSGAHRPHVHCMHTACTPHRCHSQEGQTRLESPSARHAHASRSIRGPGWRGSCRPTKARSSRASPRRISTRAGLK